MHEPQLSYVSQNKGRPTAGPLHIHWHTVQGPTQWETLGPARMHPPGPCFPGVHTAPCRRGHLRDEREAQVEAALVRKVAGAGQVHHACARRAQARARLRLQQAHARGAALRRQRVVDAPRARRPARKAATPPRQVAQLLKLRPGRRLHTCKHVARKAARRRRSTTRPAQERAGTCRPVSRTACRPAPAGPRAPCAKQSAAHKQPVRLPARTRLPGLAKLRPKGETSSAGLSAVSASCTPAAEGRRRDIILQLSLDTAQRRAGPRTSA